MILARLARVGVSPLLMSVYSYHLLIALYILVYFLEVADLPILAGLAWLAISRFTHHEMRPELASLWTIIPAILVLFRLTTLIPITVITLLMRHQNRKLPMPIDKLLTYLEDCIYASTMSFATTRQSFGMNSFGPDFLTHAFKELYKTYVSSDDICQPYDRKDVG